KAALDAWTRVVGSECISDNVHFTTIHMPLVRTPMIAPTRIYDMFPASTPEEAAEMITKAIVRRPKKVATRLGTFGELLYAVNPKASDKILNAAYKLFPDSQAAKGKHEEVPDKAPSAEAVAFAHLMKGVHW
ncbi:MAG TPA: short chain dehydrogenase, partial [Solirubrobacterales bacterium]|nr:short chain dehydrogenase [Solirubrobacterales bacterium]